MPLIFALCLFLFLLGFFLPALTPTTRWQRKLGFMAVQLLLLLIGLALGWNLVTPMLWEHAGGCAAHGGNFEGGCGFAGVAQAAIAAIFTGGIVTSVSGVLLFRIGGPAKTPAVRQPPGREEA